MSVLTEINRIKTAVTAIVNAIKGKGVSVPSTAKIDDLASYIEDIPQFIDGGGGSSIGTCTVVIDMSAILAYGSTQGTEIFYTQLQDGIWTSYEIIASDYTDETITLTDVVCGSGLTIRLKVGAYNNDTNGIMSNSGNDLFFVTVSASDGGTQTIYFEADD